MGFGLYDWLVNGWEFWPGIIPLLLAWKIIPEEQEAPITSFVFDSLEMTTILVFLIVNTILLILLERKVASGRAWTGRGPVFIDLNWGHFFSWPFGKRTWKFGLLQNVAEFLKFFSKEDIVPEKADKFPFNIGFFAFIVAPPFILGALLPLGVKVIADPAVGFLLIFALFSLYPVGVLITGWSSNNKYSLLGGFRSAAQMISYEIPLMLSVTAVVLATNSFSLVDIARQQTETIGALPFAILMPIGFIVFMTSLAAETERIPFDIPEAEAELVMGWRTELTGFRYMMSMATEYFILLIGSFIGIFLFWGGAYLPLIPGINNIIDNEPLLAFMIIVIKLWIFIFLYIWIRASLPRVRIDQLLDIGWKWLIPFAIGNIIIVIFVVVFNPQLFGVIP
ncbi:MAG: complex I subunit 1/NuoH family protein [Candidatus Hodarchaeales archaeon]|jgi:NADH:ubiquinone oxidoreductase subunit H